MLEIRTIEVGIARPWREVYEAIWRPEAFAHWASGMATAALEPDGEAWRGEGPEGPIRVTFTPHNPYGVMDHRVQTGGQVLYMPLRVIENDDGATVALTLFRQPGMDDAKFEADARWVAKDLQTLKTFVETS